MPVAVGAIDVEWRELERTGLVDQVTAALRAGRSVLLQGEAGAGKTTVARQAAPEESAWLPCLEGLASVPLAPFALVGAEVALDSVAAASRWLRDLAEAGTVLVVDDAHWIDPAGAALVAQAISNDHIRTILSVRTGHTMPPDLVRALGAARYDVIEVDPLDASMVELALELALGAPPADGAVATLTRASGGNPLYLRELVLESARAGTLRPDATGWTLTAAPELSETLTALLRARLDRHGPEVRHAVELVAATEHLPVHVLGTLTGDEHVATAIRTGLLREDGETIRPGHPTIRDAVRTGISSTAQRLLLRAVVDATTESDSPALRARRVGWQLELGDVPSATDLDHAYDAAVRALNLDLAGQLAQASHEHHPSVEHGLRAANQLHRDGKHRAAVDLVASLRPLAQTADEAARIASHLVRTQGVMGLFIGTSPDAGPLDPSIVAWADGQLEGEPFRAMHEALESFSDQNTDAIEEACVPLSEHPTPIVSYDAHELLAWVSTMLGRYELAFDHARAIAAVEDPYVLDRPRFGSIFTPLTMGVVSLGKFGEAYASTRAAYERLDNASGVVIAGVANAHLLATVLAGRVDEAHDAASLYRSANVGTPWLDANTDFLESRVRAFMGDAEAAETLGERAIAQVSSIGGYSSSLGADAFRAGLWFHRAAFGTRPDARENLRALQEECSGFALVHVMSNRVSLGDIDERLLELLDTHGTNNRFIAMMGAVARARFDEDPVRLADAADQLEQAGNDRGAAEVLTAAINLHLSRDEREAASRLLPRHRSILARCPGLRWPLVQVATDAPDLTERERQIAECAALGWSNREIADELTLSVRTVENNLQRAYTKLGVNRRAQLADALSLQPA